MTRSCFGTLQALFEFRTEGAHLGGCAPGAAHVLAHGTHETARPTSLIDWDACAAQATYDTGGVRALLPPS